VTGRRLAVLVFVVMLAAGCGVRAAGTGRQAAAAGGTVTETGSGLLYPLMRTWATAYHQQFPGVTVTTASTGSGKGISAASAGTVDIGASDAYLSSGDLVKNPGLLNIALAVSAQTIIYNLPTLGSRHLNLDGTVLAGIYDGSITTWNAPVIAALNPGVNLPGTAIVPVHRSDSSGDTFLFTSYLSTQDQQWNNAIGYGTTAAWPKAPKAVAADGSLAVLHTCETTAGCVAYNGISYLSQALSGGLGEAELANDAGKFTLPTATSVAASVSSFTAITPAGETISMIDGPSPDGYPIVNYEYAVVRDRQPDAAAIRAFLTWVITKGNAASFVGAVGFQPLSATVAALSADQIAQINP
jgi:phosphate transport system substrate-binding protein